MQHSTSRFGRAVAAFTLTMVLVAACGGGNQSSISCGELTPADMESGLLAAAFNDEFKERGVESTPARLQAARANLTQLCSDDPDREVFGAAREAAGKVVEAAD